MRQPVFPWLYASLKYPGRLAASMRTVFLSNQLLSSRLQTVGTECEQKLINLSYVLSEGVKSHLGTRLHLPELVCVFGFRGDTYAGILF